VAKLDFSSTRLDTHPSKRLSYCASHKNWTSVHQLPLQNHYFIGLGGGSWCWSGCCGSSLVRSTIMTCRITSESYPHSIANLQKMAVAERREAEPTTQHRNEVGLAVRQATIKLLAGSYRQWSCKPINVSCRSHAEPLQPTMGFPEIFGPLAWAWRGHGEGSGPDLWFLMRSTSFFRFGEILMCVSSAQSCMRRLCKELTWFLAFPLVHIRCWMIATTLQPPSFGGQQYSRD